MNQPIRGLLIASFACVACAATPQRRSESQAAESKSISIFIIDRELLLGTPPRRLALLPTITRQSEPVGLPRDLSGSLGPLVDVLVAAPACANGFPQPVSIHATLNATSLALLGVTKTLLRLGYPVQLLELEQGEKPFRLREPGNPKLRVVYGESAVWLLGDDGVALGADCNPVESPGVFDFDAPSLTLAEVSGCVAKLHVDASQVHLSAANAAVPVRALLPLLRELGKSGAVLGQYFVPKKELPASVDDARRVVAGLSAPFTACYQRELVGHAHAAGVVRLTMHVASNGSVKKIDTGVSGNLQSTVACMRTAAASAHFMPRVEDNGAVRVPVVFANPGVNPCRP